MYEPHLFWDCSNRPMWRRKWASHSSWISMRSSWKFNKARLLHPVPKFECWNVIGWLLRFSWHQLVLVYAVKRTILSNWRKNTTRLQFYYLRSHCKKSLFFLPGVCLHHSCQSVYPEWCKLAFPTENLNPICLKLHLGVGCYFTTHKPARKKKIKIYHGRKKKNFEASFAGGVHLQLHVIFCVLSRSENSLKTS